jgi:hypothetical protein
MLSQRCRVLVFGDSLALRAFDIENGGGWADHVASILRGRVDLIVR